MTRRPFLTACWSNLCLVTYAVPPALLKPRLPSGLELDTHNGTAFVSLVAFDFQQTRVLRVAWPGLVNFPELNLRYYARAGDKRGVIFIREYVPSRVVTRVARSLYHEPYYAAPMTSTVEETLACVTADRRIHWGGREHRIRVVGRKPAECPPSDSDAHFFKEHQWGFGTDRQGRAHRYEVQHPLWETYPVESYQVDVDWTILYGSEWGALQNVQPISVIFSVGSPVEVFGKTAMFQS